MVEPEILQPRMRGGIPEGWSRVDGYAIRKGKWTICRVFIAHLNGYRYELWPGQLEFGSAEEAAAQAERLEAGGRRTAGCETSDEGAAG